MRTSNRVAATVAAAVLLLAACGDGPDTTEPDTGAVGATPSPTDAAVAPTDDTTDTTGEPVTVTVVTHDSFNISDDVLAAFTEETGITIDLLAGGDAGETVNRAILSAGDPEGDVLFGVDNTFLSRALEADLFVPYESPALAGVDERFVIDDQHRVTPIDFGDVCLNYDREVLADDEVPQTLEELTGFADQLVVQNPATSSPGLAFLIATVETFGEDGYLDFWRELAEGGVTVAQGWEDAYYGQFSGGSGEGDHPLVVSYASSPPAEVFFADPPPEDVPTGVIEASCVRQIEFAGILNGTLHEAAAKQVIDWMLSRDFQEDIPLNMFVFPVIEEATLPAVFVEHATIVEDPIEIDHERIGARREEWIEAWTDTVLR